MISVTQFNQVLQSNWPTHLSQISHKRESNLVSLKADSMTSQSKRLLRPDATMHIVQLRCWQKSVLWLMIHDP